MNTRCSHLFTMFIVIFALELKVFSNFSLLLLIYFDDKYVYVCFNLRLTQNNHRGELITEN